MRYFMLFVMIGIVMLSGLVCINAIGYAEIQEAVKESHHDNMGIWIALISVLGVAIVGAVAPIVNLVLTYKLKMAQLKTDAKIDVNTEMTVQTQKYLNGNLVQEKEDSYDQGRRDERQKHASEKNKAPSSG